MQRHLHQNMCVEQPNRMLANGPNHPGPGPGPEEIPMVDVSLSYYFYLINTIFIYLFNLTVYNFVKLFKCTRVTKRCH